MSNPIEVPDNVRLANSEPRPKFDPYTGQPLEDSGVDPLEHADRMQNDAMRERVTQMTGPPDAPMPNFWAEQASAKAASGVSGGPVNPYAPTGWQRKHRTEFDITVPSGQLCRVMRIEREDLFRMNLMGYLDTFTPMLMEDTISSEERGKRIRETMATKPDSIANMFMAIDEVCMAATIRPRITADTNKVDYGGPNDWTNPNFIATALISDLSMEDRFAIFAAAFGRSMDDLKSLFEQTPSVASVADQPGVQQAAE
jgi:hypothetical protein